MKIIELDCYGIKVTLDDKGGGLLTSCLKDVCKCGDVSCNFDCQDAMEWASDRDMDCQNDKNEQLQDNKIYNEKIDIIESMVLAHAVAGIDIKSPAYLEGIETVIAKISKI